MIKEYWTKFIRFIGVPEPEAWRIVYSTYEITTFSDSNDKREYRFYFHYRESNRGARKVTFSCTKSLNNLAFVANQFPYYHDVCMLWEAGSNFEEIPSYGQSVKIENAKLKKDAIVVPFTVVK